MQNLRPPDSLNRYGRPFSAETKVLVDFVQGQPRPCCLDQPEMSRAPSEGGVANFLKVSGDSVMMFL